MSLTPLVSKESLKALEASYNQSQGVPTGISFPQIQAAASRFLGRLWAGSGSHKSLGPPSSTRPDSTIRRSPSKQSMASTLNSLESAASETSTAPTEVSASGEPKPRIKSTMSQKDKDLHGQIEDLLMAMNDLQREQASLARDLQQEREEREEDHEVSKAMLSYIKDMGDDQQDSELRQSLISRAEERFMTSNKRVSIAQTKHQLRDEVSRWKEMHEVEAARCTELSRRLDEYERENSRLKEELREARARIQEGHWEKQRLERTVQELRARKPSPSDSNRNKRASLGDANDGWPSNTGLREIKLITRTNSQRSARNPKRNSTIIGLQGVEGSTAPTSPASAGPDDSLLVELVNAKTAEAIARQELEEVKAKLDSLRKLMGSPATPRIPSSENPLNLSPPRTTSATTKSSPETNKSSAAGGFFGWGKRTVSTASAESK